MGRDLGKLEKGFPADIVAIDLEHDTLAGASDGALLPSILLAGSPALVRDAWVGGERVVEDRRHRNEEKIRADFRAAMEAIWS